MLPDLDRGLDDAAWTLLGDPDGDAVGVAGHPQAILYRLLEIVGVGRDAVRPLGDVAPALAARARFLSEALRPADSTDAWRREREATTALARSGDRKRARRRGDRRRPPTRTRRRWRSPARCAKRSRRPAARRR